MSEVKSNYNFVPAPEESEVLKPDWSDKVSHDIPFSDGESGEIKITLTAETPIFIRNGHTEGAEENEFSFYMDNKKKQYFIPGSSVKGMVRNVLEIMSRSRIKVQDDIFSYRNLKDRDFKNEVMHNKSLKTGWLSKAGGAWIIEACEMKRIDLRNRMGGNYSEMTAAEKYHQFGNNPDQNFRLVRTIPSQYGPDTEIFTPSANGNFNGKVVFFGGMNNKKYEYIFSSNTTIRYDVATELIDKFEAIDEKLKDTQWQYYKSENIQRIPVFFYSSDNNNVDHFGFGRLYKISNTKFLREISPLSTYYATTRYAADLAETIFGNVEDRDEKRGNIRNKISLKGRVNCGHGKIVGSINEATISPVDVVLASPKASYYPYYLKSGNYYSQNPEINGFKRYPVHTSPRNSDLNPDNQDIQSVIKPLPAKTQFTAKIRFHNLRKVEIGALLSALTFHGNEKDLHHTIGSGKPLGYGRTSLNIDQIKVLKTNDNGEQVYQDQTNERDQYLTDFELMMDQRCKNKSKKWIESEEIIELFAMANDPRKEHLLRYPTLENPNEFVNFSAKGLPSYSEINGEFNANSVAQKALREMEEKRLAQEEAQRQQLQKEKETRLLAIETANKKSLEESKIKNEALRANAKNVVIDFPTKDFKSVKKALDKHYRDHKITNDAHKLLSTEQKTDLLKTLNQLNNKTDLLNKLSAPINKYPWSDLSKWIGGDAVTEFRDSLKPDKKSNA